MVIKKNFLEHNQFHRRFCNSANSAKMGHHQAYEVLKWPMKGNAPKILLLQMLGPGYTVMIGKAT